MIGEISDKSETSALLIAQKVYSHNHFFLFFILNLKTLLNNLLIRYVRSTADVRQRAELTGVIGAN